MIERELVLRAPRSEVWAVLTTTEGLGELVVARRHRRAAARR